MTRGGERPSRHARGKTRPVVTALLVCCTATTAASAAEPTVVVRPFTATAVPANVGKATIKDLLWLSGCWASERGESGSGEQWSAPAGGAMLGTSRTVRGGRTIEYEFVIIREVQNGGIEYVAHPSGQATAAFTLASIGDREVLFENATHDFPQRVGYRLDATGKSLQAWIEGAREGATRRVEFPMVRTPCDSAPTAVASLEDP
jgi:hypothetical protein